MSSASSQPSPSPDFSSRRSASSRARSRHLGRPGLDRGPRVRAPRGVPCRPAERAHRGGRAGVRRDPGQRGRCGQPAHRDQQHGDVGVRGPQAGEQVHHRGRRRRRRWRPAPRPGRRPRRSPGPGRRRPPGRPGRQPAPASTGLPVPVVPETWPATVARSSGEKLGHHQAVLVGGVRGEHAHAAGVAEHRDPAARGQRLLGEQQRGLGHVLGAGAGDHAGLGEQRIDADRRRRRGRGVGGTGPAAARGAAARPRRAAACARRSGGRTGRTSARCRTTRGRARRRSPAGRRARRRAGRCWTRRPCCPARRTSRRRAPVVGPGR